MRKEFQQYGISEYDYWIQKLKILLIPIEARKPAFTSNLIF